MQAVLDRLLRPAVTTCVLLLSAVHADSALAQLAVSMLNADGVVEHIADVPQPRMVRTAIGERGDMQTIDEYAVVAPGSSSLGVSYATDAFESAPAQARTLATKLQSAKPASAKTALLIQHQVGHPDNHNFAPTPTAAFRSQPIRAPELEGQRGFAIVTIGGSGAVLRTRLVSAGEPIRNATIQNAVATGVATTFPDQRRHDHTVYFAYEVRNQSVQMLGRPLVTFPQCDRPPPGC